MSDKVLSVKLDEDTDLYQRFDEFESEYQTRSEAIRAALRRGIPDDGEESDGTASASDGDDGFPGPFRRITSPLGLGLAIVMLAAVVEGVTGAALVAGAPILWLMVEQVRTYDEIAVRPAPRLDRLAWGLASAIGVLFYGLAATAQFLPRLFAQLVASGGVTFSFRVAAWLGVFGAVLMLGSAALHLRMHRDRDQEVDAEGDPSG